MYRRFQGDFSRWGGGGSGVTWEDLSMEEYIMREENFHEGVQDFLSLSKKNNEKINNFFQLEVMRSIKT